MLLSESRVGGKQNSCILMLWKVIEKVHFKSKAKYICPYFFFLFLFLRNRDTQVFQRNANSSCGKLS